MLSIIVLDNYPILRYGINNLLRNNFEDIQITEVESLKDIPQFEKKIKPDLIILGINDNSRKQDLELYYAVKQFFPISPVIVYDEIIYDFKTLPYLEFGIEGYVLKQNNPSELLRSIEIVLTGKRYICNAVLQNLYHGFLLEESGLARKQLLMNLRNQA
ncbi:hypothetical protein [Dyadobacter sp. 3J3]|uniref:hypothetical protein n=1 Tax=Dyadobacter sp. 3J3 TaxID=2606600 RepID=UPI001359B976|nr:hypothetical protein [Dyadobacter sp. 3J3]